MRIIIQTLTVAVLLATFVLGCSNGVGEGIPFSIQVRPPIITHAYAGQAYIFSVTAMSNETGKAVNLSVSVTDCDVTVNPKAIKPGQSSKVSVVPSATSVGKTLTITIEGERDGLIEKATATIEMGDTGDSGEGT